MEGIPEIELDNCGLELALILTRLNTFFVQ